MDRVRKYRQQAEECRKLANGMPADQRDKMLEMASTWERLASERETLLHALEAVESTKH